MCHLSLETSDLSTSLLVGPCSSDCYALYYPRMLRSAKYDEVGLVDKQQACAAHHALCLHLILTHLDCVLQVHALASSPQVSL